MGRKKEKVKSTRRKGINGRAKGMAFEYAVRDELKNFVFRNFDSEQFQKFRELMQVAFALCKRNNEATAGQDTNDLAIDIDEVPDSMVAVLRKFPLHVECKNRVTVSLKDAYEQSVEALKRTGGVKRIVLITKETYKPTHPNFTGKMMVTMELSDFMDFVFNAQLFPRENPVWREPVRVKKLNRK